MMAIAMKVTALNVLKPSKLKLALKEPPPGFLKLIEIEFLFNPNLYYFLNKLVTAIK